jgi:amino acid transporter
MSEGAEAHPAGSSQASPPPSAARRRAVRGARPGDRRVRIDAAGSAYFRHLAPDVLRAKPAAIEARNPVGRALERGRRLALGRPLATSEEATERLSKVQALAVFSSDNLSSVAYATEAILFTLLIAGRSTFWLALPISALIVLVLGIIVVSYRQTIRGYPGGGGSYIVARANLGVGAGMVAAAALLTDYVLTVAVSVAAGVAAITSAFPELSADVRVPVAAVCIALVTVVNLRGIRDSGTVFAVPTYVFLGSMLLLIGVGLLRTIVGDIPVATPAHPLAAAAEPLGVLLLMRAFADGCSAITGVEAVSNGVPAFRVPEWRNARTTLTVMAVLVGVLFLGTSILALVAGTAPDEHETILSQLGHATFGTGPLYYVLQLSTMGILVLAANTAFADFPRLASLLARDGLMPSRFAYRGERLAFNAGIVALAALAVLVLAAFGGRVEALIPLYAIGVFTSITLSQAGMVRHWRRNREPGWQRSLAVNAAGAVATGIVALIFGIAKFALGAWLVVIVIPVLVAGMWAFGRLARRRRVATRVDVDAVVGPPLRRQRVYVPVSDITRDVVQALKFARTMADDVRAVHVTDDVAAGEALRERFARQLPAVPLVIVESPYRELVRPLIRFLEERVAEAGDDMIVVLLPEYVPARRWERLVNHGNGDAIKTALLGLRNVLVAEVPYRRPS